jgi:hypothetical protein
VLLKVILPNFAQAPDRLQSLRPKTLSNTYTYLGMRALDSSMARRRSLVALRCLGKAIAYDFLLITRRPGVLAIIAAKIMLAALLPRRSAALLSSFRRLKRLPRS